MLRFARVQPSIERPARSPPGHEFRRELLPLRQLDVVVIENQATLSELFLE